MLRFLFWAVVIGLLVRFILQKRGPAIRPPPGRRDEADPYTVLGVSRQASQDEIRQAYQQKMRENHPDKVAGMSREIRDLAEKRSKEINIAYEALKK